MGARQGEAQARAASAGVDAGASVASREVDAGASVASGAVDAGASVASGELDARTHVASEALDALGDANRRAIVQILSAGGRSVQEIADDLPISRPAVSRHLRLLKGAGLVGDRTQGTRHVYELRAEGVEAIRDYFATVWDSAVTRFRIVAENVENRSHDG